MPSLDHAMSSFLVALGVGLLIGVERERRKGQGPARASAGIRTFAITSLLGAASMAVGGEVLLGITTGGVAVLSAVAYLVGRSEDPGLTTEITLVLTVVLGGLAMREPAMASAIAVVTTAVLAARAPMHRFVSNVLSESELRSALIFGIATLVVWPLVPDRYMGPFSAINPRAIWSIVILVLAIGAAGYVAVRSLGVRYGLPLAGLAAGFVSSSAAIASMGARAAENPQMLRPAAAGALLSNVATVVQLAVLLAATSTATLYAIWPPLACAAAAAVLAGLAFSRSQETLAAPEVTSAGEAFSLKAALILAVVLAVILVAVAALREWLGERGVLAGATLAGFADAHATAVSIASLVASSKMTADDARLPILLAFTSNSLTKVFLAVTGGSRAFSQRVVPGILLVLAAAWGGLLLAVRVG